MRRSPGFVVALTAVLIAVGCTTTSTPREGENAAAEATFDSLATRFANHVKAGNMDSVAAFYSEDAVLMPPNLPPATGRSAIRETFTAMLQGATLNDFRLVPTDVRMSGDMVRERGRYAMSFTVPGQGAMSDSGKYVVVWIRQSDGSWLLDSDIWNSDIALAPPAAADTSKAGN